MVLRRLVPAFLIALLMSALLTWFLGRKLARPATVAAARVERLVAVTRDLNVGDTLDTSSLQLVDWAANSPPKGSFTKPEEVAGRVLLYPLAVGQPVLDRFLAASGTGAGLLARIPAGMRAVSVHADEVAGVAGFVSPNTFVDVLVTNRDGATDANMATTTILQDVRVLAVGQKTEAEQDGKSGTPAATVAATVTLLLSPRNAQKLTLAGSLGRIVLVLRNGADRVQVTELPPEKKTSDPAAAVNFHTPVVSRSIRSTVATPQTDSFTVQTIAGGKQTQQTFEGKNKR